MAAVGFATLPVIPSFEGVSARIEKAISQPIQKASKAAGDALGKGVSAGVDESAKNVEKAQFRVKKSTQELEAAESKLTEQKHKSEAANLAVEAAARKREDAEGKGIEAVSKAEQDLLKKRATAEREARNLIKAEEAHESALTESSRAAKSLSDRQDELAKANEGSSRTFKDLRDEVRLAGDELDETAERASTFGDKLVAGLETVGRGMLLGIGAKIGTTVMDGVHEAMSTGWETALSIDQVSRSLSAMTSETQVAEDMMVSLREVASDRPIDYTSFLEGANTLAYMGYEGEQAIQVMDNVGRAAVGAGRDGDDAMQTVIGALGKMQANGKVTANEIGQISNTGVPMLSALIDHFDMAEGSFGELSSMITEGKVDLEDVIAALEEAGGADFENLHNSFENVNSSLENQIAMLKDNVFTSIGEALQPILQDMDFEAIADTVGDVVGRIISLLPGMVEIAMTAFDKLSGVIGDVSGVLESVWGWIEKNKDALKALAVGIGIAVGAWTLFNGIMQAHAISIQIADKGWKGYILSTKAATAAAKLFNKATKANVIGLIATALIAVGGALVYFFTKTETGRKLWEKFTNSLGDAWDWVVEKFTAGWDWLRDNVFDPFMSFVTETVLPALQAAWDGIQEGWDSFVGALQWAYENIIQPVWDAIVTAGQWLTTVLVTAVITPIMLYWEALSWAIQTAWETIIKPAWDALAAAATWLWEKVLSPVFTWIGDKWTEMSETFASVWETIKTAVFDAFTWYINRVKANFEIVTGALNTAWTWLKDQFLIVWGFIRDLVFTAWNNAVNNVSAVFSVVMDALAAAWTWLKDRFVAVWDVIRDAVVGAFENAWNNLQAVFETVTGLIISAWDWLRDQLFSGWNWIKENVFDAMGRGLDTVKGWFDTGVEAIKKIWDGLKRKLAEPINFVIRTVYNDGIKKVFDGVAEKVGLDSRLPTINEIGGFREGGILPGYSRMADGDDQLVPMRSGEGVLVSEGLRDRTSREMFLSANEHAKRGGSFASFVGEMGTGYATGGIINYAGALSAIQESHARFIAKHFPDMFALTSASRSEPGSFHDYATQGATDWQAQDGQYATQMPTPHSKKLARAIFTNFSNSAELIHYPLDGWQNIWNGSPHDYGPGTNADHQNHVHWATRSPLSFDGADIVLDDMPSSGGFSFNPLDWFTSLWDRITGKLPKFDLQGFGDMAQVPDAGLKTMGGWLKDWALGALKEWADKFMNFMGFSGGGADQWRDLASEALKRMGYGDEHLDAMLQQIQIESTGDPNAVNMWDENATVRGTPSGGLLQVIEPTYQDVRRRYPDAFEGLPDDRMHPLTNLTAGVGAVKRDWGGPAGRWPTKDGYAMGGVLPGYSPGRDIHQFFSPTAGSVAFSGGESIMVPEWTKLVGGPRVVAALNHAASGGRTPGAPGAFAAGGVWGGVNSASDGFMKQFSEAAKNLNEAAEKLVDASSDEGVMARAGLSKLAEGFGLIGFNGSANVISALLGAENELMEARDGYAVRTTAIAEAEAAHAEAVKELATLRKSDSKMSVENQKKIADAEEVVAKAKEDRAKASGDKQSAAAEKLTDAEEKLARVREEVSKDAEQDAQAHADELAAATEKVTSAENELAKARQESMAALDVRIFDIAPQISGMLSQAAGAASAIPQVSSALAGMAAMAGPAGISVGVAVQGILTAIDLVQKIGTAIGDFVSSIFAARTAMYSLTVQGSESIYNASKMLDDMRSTVVGLRISWVEAQVSLRDATWKTRLAQADVVRAQLEGVKSVAEAEAALEAERKRVARAAALDLDDLSLLYDRYRWLEYEGLKDRLDLSTIITPEILALEAEVNAAKLTALANQREASLSALQASFEQQKAALNLQQVQANLAMQTQQLALMQAEFGGFGQAESLQAMNTAKLYEERSQIQQQMGQNFWRLPYHLTGASAADKKRIAELDKLIAEREESGAGIGETVKGTDWMSFFGYGESASNALKNSGYGSAEEAMWKLQEQQQLQQIEQQKKELEQQIEQNKLFEEYQKQIGDLTAEIEALKAGASASQYEADSYREDNPAVKAALEALAKFEAERSKEYGDVAAGKKQVVEITIPEQDTYTREQVDALLNAVKEIGSIDARVKMLETPEKPGANDVLADITRRY